LPDYGVRYLIHWHRTPEEPLHGRHPFIGDSAGDDQSKPGKVGADVQRETVAGDPSRDAHPDRREFLVAYPDPREPVDPAGPDPELRNGTNEDFLEIAHIAVHVAAIRFQVDDGIADELPRSVKRDIAAAAALEQRDSFRGEPFGRVENVRAVMARLRAEGDDGRMFEEQELIGDPSLLALFDQRVLQIERRLVFDGTEPADFQDTSGRIRARLRRSSPGVP
jgi:hypothetical protein